MVRHRLILLLALLPLVASIASQSHRSTAGTTPAGTTTASQWTSHRSTDVTTTSQHTTGTTQTSAATTTAHQPLVCPQTSDRSLQLPDLSLATLKSFEMAVEVVSYLDNVTTSILEVHDAINRQGGMLVAERGREYRVLYDGTTHQAIQVQGDNCSFGSMTNLRGADVSWLNRTDDNAWYYGPSSLLRLTSAIPYYSYTPRVGYIRGVDAQMWRGCNNDLVYDVYLPTPNWDTPVSSRVSPDNIPLPLAIRVRPINGTEDQQVFYSFTAYQPYLTHTELLQMPVGVSCPGRISVDPDRVLPVLPDRFRMNVEAIFDPALDLYLGDDSALTLMALTNYDVGYDAPHKLIAYQFRPHREQEPVRLVQDFNTGASYMINMVSGNCRIGPISATDIGDFIVSGRGHFMDEPDQFFYMNRSFTYAGQKQERGIHADVWTLTVDGDDIREFGTNFSLDLLSIEQHLSAHDVVWQHDGSVSAIPLRTDLLGYVVGRLVAAVSLNVHDFSVWSGIDSSGLFDVSPCFDLDSQRTVFELVLKGGPRSNWSDVPFVDQVKQGAFESVLNVSGVSPVRISQVQVDTDNTFLYWRASLLERAPYLVRFVETPGCQMNHTDATVVTVHGGAEDCARLCAEGYGNRPCTAFDMCDRTVCVMSSNWSVPSRLEPANCSHFDLSEDNTTTEDPSSWQAMDALQVSVAARNLTVPVVLYGMRYVLTATDIHVLSGSNQDKPQFHLTKTAMLDNPEATTSTDTLTGCEQRCSHELSFDCDSFSFCFDHSCQMSPIELTNSTAKVGCQLYERNWLSMFDLTPGGVSLSRPGDRDVPNVKDPSSCASLCVHETSFTCRSFDYCVLSRTCSLYQTRTLNWSSAAPSNDTACSHYQRRAVGDFRLYPKQTTWYSGLSRLGAAQVSADECAALCEDQTKFECKSFDLCVQCPSNNKDDCPGLGQRTNGGGLCLLSPLGAKVTKPDIASFDGCDHYLRESFGTANDEYGSDETFSGRELAGLGMGMLVVGCALTGMGVAVWRRKCRHRKGSMSTSNGSRREPSVSLHFHNPMSDATDPADPRGHPEPTVTTQVVY